MNLPAVGCDEGVLDRLRRKLRPSRFPNMSGKFSAIVGFLLDIEFTDPAFAELIVTSDGCVLARCEDDCGCNDFIGRREDLGRNWASLLDAAELDASERAEAERRLGTMVRKL